MKQLLHRRTLLVLCILLLSVLFVIPAAAENNLLRLEYTGLYVTNYGDSARFDLNRPYTTMYFLNDSEIYSTDGSSGSITNYYIVRSTETTIVANIGGKEFYIGKDTATCFISWYGGSQTESYNVLRDTPVFRSALNCEASGHADAPYLFTCSAAGGIGEYTYSYSAVDEAGSTRYYGSTSEPQFSIIFRAPGNYRVFLTAMDEEGFLSEYSCQEVTVGDFPTLPLGSETITIPDYQPIHRQFIAPADGSYIFYSETDSCTPAITVVDADGNQLAYDRSSGNGSNFLCQVELKKGQTVTLHFDDRSGKCVIPVTAKMAAILHLPADLVIIEEDAFANTDFNIIEVGTSCRSIAANAFRGCSYIAQVRVPGGSGIDIAYNAFPDCSPKILYK